MLNKKTTDKIKIYGKDYEKDLHETIGKQNLPDFLGGYIEDWENYDMPWKEYKNYCFYEQKTWFHCDEMRVSDPMIKSERYPMDIPVTNGSKTPKERENYACNFEQFVDYQGYSNEEIVLNV